MRSLTVLFALLLSVACGRSHSPEPVPAPEPAPEPARELTVSEVFALAKSCAHERFDDRGAGGSALLFDESSSLSPSRQPNRFLVRFEETERRSIPSGALLAIDAVRRTCEPVARD